MGHLVNHNAFRLGAKSYQKLETTNNINLFLVALINAFLLRFNIRIVDFSYKATSNFFLFSGLIFINAKKTKKRKKRHFIKKNYKIKSRYKKKLSTTPVRKIHYNRKKSREKKAIYVANLKYAHRFKKKFKVTKNIKKKIIKNYIKLFKLKLKLQQLLFLIAKKPVKLKLKNSWNCYPKKHKKIRTYINNGAWYHKKKYRNIDNLINIMAISFKLKQPKLLTEYMAKEVSKAKKHWGLLNATKYLIQEFKRRKFGIKGFQLTITGKINGNDRSRKHTIKIGSIPLSTMSKNLKYSFSHSYSAYGMFGIKSWLSY